MLASKTYDLKATAGRQAHQEKIEGLERHSDSIAGHRATSVENEEELRLLLHPQLLHFLINLQLFHVVGVVHELNWLYFLCVLRLDLGKSRHELSHESNVPINGLALLRQQSRLIHIRSSVQNVHVLHFGRAHPLR